MMIEEQNKVALENKEALIKKISDTSKAIKAGIPELMGNMKLGEFEARGGIIKLPDQRKAGQSGMHDIVIEAPFDVLRPQRHPAPTPRKIPRDPHTPSEINQLDIKIIATSRSGSPINIPLSVLQEACQFVKESWTQNLSQKS